MRIGAPESGQPRTGLLAPGPVGLVDRLVALDARVHQLEREKSSLRQQLAAAKSQQPALAQEFDVPRTLHDWPLAEDPARAPETLWLYDIRPDDAVVLEGRRGAAFLASFGLLGEAPDFAAATDALNREARNRLAPPSPDMPDVSIVMPVHGQLAYTLNALASLMRHASRYAWELILVDDASPDASSVYLPQLERLRYHRQAEQGGFIAASNAGAALARGRFIVMLNNDTRVVDGWLDALIDSFAHWPRAGLVGAKMHYPDGSLQEAGGILWRDGSASHDGHGDDPNRPQYCYARQVDYVSGCAIALPLPVWREMGGFDTAFAPAYYEDADLAFRLRAAGYEVWFQPQARIVHYEGKTSGTDLEQGAKAYQRVNEKKFLLRWRTTLSRHRPHGQAPFFERERDVHRHILVVDITTPTPDQDAGSVQTVLALQACMALGYKTHFVPQDNFLFQQHYTSALQLLGVACAYAPFETGFEAYLQRYGWQFDAVLVFRPSVMEKCLPHIRAYAPQAAALFHVADLHSLRMARSAALAGDADLREAAALMQERELRLVRMVDCTITHSTWEQQLLGQAEPGCPVAVWPLLCAYHGTQKPFAERRDICFLGGYGHPPNVDAVLYFVREIFPILRARSPGMRFIIAGSHVQEEILALAAPDIIIAGQIADLRDLFDPCRVFVCPLRVGAGVKGKIASALSYGIPIVSTAIGIEGTALEPGRHLLMADEAEAFAEEILRLYHDPDLWDALSTQGLAFARAELSPEAGERALASALHTAFAHKSGLAA